MRGNVASCASACIVLLASRSTIALGEEINHTKSTNSEHSNNCVVISGIDIDSIDTVMELAVNSAGQQASDFLGASAKDLYISSKRFFYPQIEFTFSGNSMKEKAWSSTFYDLPKKGIYEQSETYPSYWTNTPILQLTQNVLDLSQMATISQNFFGAKASIFSAIANAQSSALKAANYLVSYVTQSYMVKASKTLASIYKKQYEDSNLLYAAGEASKIDLLNAKQQYISYLASIKTAQALKDGFHSDLNAVTNSVVCDYEPGKEGFSSIGQLPGLQKTIDMQSKAVSLSPLVNSYFSSATQYSKQALSYDLSYLPTVSLSFGATGTYEYGNIAGVSQPSSEYDNTADIYAQMNVTWNFDGGQNLAMASSARNQSNSYKQNALQEVITVSDQYNTSVEQDSQWRESVEGYKKALEVQSEVMSLNLIGYRAGFLNYTDVQTQANALFSNYNSYYSSVRSFMSNRLTYQSLFLYEGYPVTNKRIAEIKASFNL